MHYLLASSFGTVGSSKSRDLVLVLPPSYFSGFFSRVQVFRSCHSVTAIYTLLGGSLRASHPSSPPPRGGTSFGRVVVLHCLGDPGWTWTPCNAGWSFGFCPCCLRQLTAPLASLYFGFLYECSGISIVFCWNTAKVFLLLPPHLFDLFLHLRLACRCIYFLWVAGVRLVPDQSDLG